MTYLSVKEAADIAEKNERTIRRWIKANKIKSSKIRGRFHVDEDSLYELMKVKGRREKGEKKLNKHIKYQTYQTEEIKKAQKNNSKPINTKKEIYNNMPGQTQSVREEDVRTSNIVSDKLKQYIRLLEVENNEYKSQISNLKFQTKQKEERKNTGDLQKINHKPSKNLPRHIIDKNFIKEGEEYVLNGGGDEQKMSGHGEFNMSVNKLSDIPITSQVLSNNDVEMSVLTGDDMSDSSLSSLDKYLDSIPNDVMSDFSGHLSTKSDIPVDNSFDRRGMIDTENQFSGDTDKMSGQKFGHNYRTVELSAYASRLIDEKERVARKFEEQNDFLKNELSELRKEVSALRGVVAGESKNRTNTSEFLIRMNESLQNKHSELMKRLDKERDNNYELLITNYELKENQENNRIIENEDTYIQKETIRPEDNKANSDSEELKNIERNILNAINMEKPDKKSPDITELHKMFLTGMGLGMIFGFLCVSLIVYLLSTQR